MKILVVLFRTLGDVLMGTTVVRAIREKNPDAQIDFVTAPQSKDILVGNPDINNIVILDSYYDANMYYIDNDYDEIYRLGMSTLMDTAWHHLPDQQNQHLVEWYAKRADLQELPDKDIYIYLSEEDIECVDDYWEDLDQDERYVAVHTTSGNHPGVGPIDSKDWQIDKFKELVANIEASGFKVIQVGAFSDKKLMMPGVVDFTGKFTFKQTAEVFKRCEAFVGVDSGPAYLASWAKIKTLLIMGATQNLGEGRGPNVGPRGDHVYYLNAPKPQNSLCQPVPCYVRCQIPEKDRGCISDISVDRVFAKFNEIIKNK